MSDISTAPSTYSEWLQLQPLSITTTWGTPIPYNLSWIKTVDWISISDPITYSDLQRSNWITSIIFDNLYSCSWNLFIRFSNTLQSVSFPVLKKCWSFQPSSNPVLTTIDCPELEVITSQLNITNNALLTTVNLPKLKIVTTALAVTNCWSLKTLNLPLLEHIIPDSNIGLWWTWNVLETISMPSVINGCSISSSAMTSLINITYWTVWITKNITWNISITGAKLSQASVDWILAVLASLDWTNGTTIYWTWKTVNLSWWISSTPSASWLASKAILVDRWVTVTHN